MWEAFSLKSVYSGVQFVVVLRLIIWYEVTDYNKNLYQTHNQDYLV